MTAELRQAEMFPSLDVAAVDRMRPAGRERAFRAGEILFEQGEASTRFLVVLDGAIEVVHPTANGEQLITVHEVGGFTGEISMLAGMPSLVRMRARSTGRALELDRSALRAVISGDSELSDILMRAFILRRGALISTEQGDVVLLGSRHSAGTLRAQEFLTRNGHPHATIDVERDPTAQACATAIEARLCGSDEVIIVGGGNSAGQAAVYLAHTARKVNILVRGKGLADTMSRYLIQRIHDTPNIELRVETEIVELAGDDHLERVTSRDRRTGERATQPIRHVFMMTGASPNTEWLSGCVVLDRNGFIKTGPDLTRDDLAGARWPLARPPLLFETSLPGVFAVGDVRASSVKRVASAVGEGSICIQLVHKVLAE